MGSLPPGVDPSKIPLAPNPDGSPPNFVDPPSLKGVVLEVGITFTVITGIVLILRLFTNFKLQRKLGLGDFFGTVLVSCAPALSAFWLQIFSQSRIYTILHSRIHPGSTTAKSLGGSGQGSGSTSHLKHNNNNQYSMFDDDKSDQSRRGFHTRIYSTEGVVPGQGPTPIPMNDVIAKYSHVQQEERRV
ncbi:MAG: hypothetical protein Q9160_007013 [Pyrenula sp. 1 TL-2023]